MATNASPSTQSSDLPWIIGSGLVFVPTIAWILSSGKGEKHANHAPKAPNEHVKAAGAVKDAPEEPVPEPAAEPTPGPVPEERPAEATPEPSVTESVVSDSDAVVISKDDLEESINRAVDADAPKEAKAVEATEATSSDPAPAPSESEPVKDSQAAALSEETTESTPPPVSEEAKSQ